MDYINILSDEQMYQTYNFIPKKRTYKDIKISLYPVSNNYHIYRMELTHLGDWVFDARLCVNLDILDIEQTAPDIIKLIDSIELEIGAQKIELIDGNILDLIHKINNLHITWIQPTLIMPLGLNLLSKLNGIPISLINSEFQEIYINIKFTNKYKIMDAGCYLKFYNVENFCKQRQITNPLPQNYLEYFTNLIPASTQNNFFASNFIYYDYRDFNLIGSLYEKFNINLHLCGSKIFWCLRDNNNDLVEEQFFKFMILSIKGHDVLSLEYPLIKHSCSNLPVGYYFIDFESMVNFSRIDINAMKLTFYMVENYKKYSGYKLNIYAQISNTIYYMSGCAKIMLSH